MVESICKNFESGGLVKHLATKYRGKSGSLAVYIVNTSYLQPCMHASFFVSFNIRAPAIGDYAASWHESSGPTVYLAKLGMTP